MTKVRRMCRQQSDSASSLGGAEGNHRAKGAAALNGRDTISHTGGRAQRALWTQVQRCLQVCASSAQVSGVLQAMHAHLAGRRTASTDLPQWFGTPAQGATRCSH